MTKFAVIILGALLLCLGSIGDTFARPSRSNSHSNYQNSANQRPDPIPGSEGRPSRFDFLDTLIERDFPSAERIEPNGPAQRRETPAERVGPDGRAQPREVSSDSEDEDSLVHRNRRDSRAIHARRALEEDQDVVQPEESPTQPEIDCSICLEKLVEWIDQDGIDENVVTLKCGHKFHPHCIQVWLNEQADSFPWQKWSCPYCRKPLVLDDVIPRD